MKTISRMFRAIAFVLHQIWLAAQTPRTMKIARWNLITWGIVSGCALFAFGMDAVSAALRGEWWDWSYLWNGTVLCCDLIMLRAALIGYLYRKTKDAEDRQFVEIIIHGFTKQP